MEKPRIAKGKREIFRGIDEGEIALVVLAEDTDRLFKRKIRLKCAGHFIPCEENRTREELQIICGIDVPCGAIGYYK